MDWKHDGLLVHDTATLLQTISLSGRLSSSDMWLCEVLQDETLPTFQLSVRVIQTWGITVRADNMSLLSWHKTLMRTKLLHIGEPATEVCSFIDFARGDKTTHTHKVTHLHICTHTIVHAWSETTPNTHTHSIKHAFALIHAHTHTHTYTHTHPFYTYLCVHNSYIVYFYLYLLSCI